MDRDNRNSRNDRSGSGSDSDKSRRLRRGGYEEDYAPHYSGQRNQSKRPSTDDYPEKSPRPERFSNIHEDGPIKNAHHKSAPGRKKKHMVGRVLAIIQGFLSIIALALLFVLDVIPLRYLGIAALLLALLWVFAYFSQFTRGTHIAGKVESLILCVALAWGCYYLFITNSFLDSITGSSVKVDNIVIAVLEDDPAQTLEDAAEYVFGIQSTLDRDNVDKTIEEINSNLGAEITTQEYEGISNQVAALYSGEVGAIIYNEAFNENIIEEYATFEEDIRILDNVKIETEVIVASSDIEVTQEPFTIYISGIDTYGEIATTSRSDVNILVTVNPETKQILLTTTPRDYYVEFPGVTNGQLDKLTHAGIYGVDCSMDTLAQLYGVDIDYYARVNFTSVINIVDALGGLEVYSEYAFTSIDGYVFQQGYNEMDGETALAFVRERYNLEDGDNQRGKNQQAVITAMLKKVMSPTILANYASLLSSLDGSFETNMSTNDITELIKMQLNDGAEWNIVSQSVVGTDGNDYCYSLHNTAYVMIPDMDSVNEAAEKIQQVLDGEIITDTTSESTEESY